MQLELCHHHCQCCHHCLICTALLITWLMPVSSYMWHLRGIFVGGTYMTIKCEVDITVACSSIYVQKTEYICPCSKMAVWLIFEMWQPRLFSDLSIMCTLTWQERFGAHVCTQAYICILIHGSLRGVFQTIKSCSCSGCQFLNDWANYQLKFMNFIE